MEMSVLGSSNVMQIETSHGAWLESTVLHWSQPHFLLSILATLTACQRVTFPIFFLSKPWKGQ